MRSGLLVLLLAACSSVPPPSPAVEARRLDEDAVLRLAPELDAPRLAHRFVVIEGGRVVAAASLPDDAVRAALRDDPAPLHRFVFRPEDRGPRAHRMAYVAEGGVVVGRRFLADLELEDVVTDTGSRVLRRRGSAGGIPLAATSRVALVVTTLDGARRERIAAVYDPDFDGGLLLPRSFAERLALELFEIPGDADVEVALGRPFHAHRATVLVRVEALDVSGPVETLTEAAGKPR